MTTRKFGYSKLTKSDVTLIELKNKHGMKVNIITFGAAVQSIYLPWKNHCKSDNFVSVVLGYDNVEDYEINSCYIGVIAGRVAGRISNGKFKVDDKEYHVTVNNGPNCLHGGKIGLSRKNWKISKDSIKENSVELECISYDMEEGFPGDLLVKVKYTVTDNNGLLIGYDGKLSKTAGCPVNLTNHSYFNLSGVECVHDGIKDHKVEIRADQTLELDSNLIPTGKYVTLDGSALDLRADSKGNGKNMKNLVDSVNGGADTPRGFDNFYILREYNPQWTYPSPLAYQARVIDNYNLTQMSVFTNQRGIQFYTSNYFDNVRVCGPYNLMSNASTKHCEYHHKKHGALCLETQDFPDCINHFLNDSNAKPILRPNQNYKQCTLYQFEQLQ